MPYHPPMKFNETFLEQALLAELEKLVSTGQLSEESYSKLRDHEGEDPESAAMVDYVGGLFQQKESTHLQLTTAQTQAVINAYCRDAVSRPVQVSTATDKNNALTHFFATVSSKAKRVVATASDLTAAALCKR